NPAVAVDFHQPLDVQADVLAEVALDFALVGDDLADAPHFILGEVFHARVAIHLGLAEDVARARAADAEDVGEADFDALVQWKIDACDTCHCLVSSWLSAVSSRAHPPLRAESREPVSLSLSLLMLRVVTNDAND